MKTLSPILFIPTVLLILSSCAVQIHDAQFCSPIPGSLGAACDNFLTNQPLFLTEQQWLQWQASVNAKGDAVECTSSTTFGDIKDEIEKFCSHNDCNWPVATPSPTPSTSLYVVKPVHKNGYSQVHEGLEKIENLGKDYIK